MSWKCPKCGREFEKQNQDHYCIKPRNIEEYIAAQDEKVQPRLKEIRRNIIHFAASKKHLGLYPGGEATAVFADELAGYEVSKGTIRLPYDQELPVELIKKIARWCCEKYTK